MKGLFIVRFGRFPTWLDSRLWSPGLSLDACNGNHTAVGSDLSPPRQPLPPVVTRSVKVLEDVQLTAEDRDSRRRPRALCPQNGRHLFVRRDLYDRPVAPLRSQDLSTVAYMTV